MIMINIIIIDYFWRSSGELVLCFKSFLAGGKPAFDGQRKIFSCCEINKNNHNHLQSKLICGTIGDV